MKNILPLIFFLSAITVQMCMAQAPTLEGAIQSINKGDFREGLRILEKVDVQDLAKEDAALFHFYRGYSLNTQDRQDEAYLAMLKAHSLYTELGSAGDVKDCNIQLLKILSHQNELKVSTQPILDELEQYAKNQDSPDVYFSIYRELGGNYIQVEDGQAALDIFNKSLELSKEVRDTLQMAYDLMNISTVHSTLLNDHNRAIQLNKSALSFLRSQNDSLNIAYNFNNLSQSFQALKKYDSALYYLFKADAMQLKSNSKKSKVIFYENIIDIYAEKGEFEKAYTYSILLKELRDSINNGAQDIAIQDFKTKYEVAEKEKQNLILTSEKTRNQNIAIGLAGTLLLLSIIGVLIYRNTKRKQYIAEQEQQIQIQKTEKVLKEKEIETINAMVSGQEKERQRLAGELHDNLGGTLAAVKMHLGNIENSLHQREEVAPLMDKLNELVGDAYTKVRGIAHERNSGVMAKDGLLPAVEKLARTVSSNQGLKIEVQDFGLEKRLGNDLEIVIFRIIQELITNIIKHAHATEATVALTQHDNELNILVEDNGKGFTVGKLALKDGMGLGSIERRIEHLEGTMEVDSSPGNGTNIIIDIPI